jgi:hypothetical protein
MPIAYVTKLIFSHALHYDFKSMYLFLHHFRFPRKNKTFGEARRLQESISFQHLCLCQVTVSDGGGSQFRPIFERTETNRIGARPGNTCSAAATPKYRGASPPTHPPVPSQCQVLSPLSKPTSISDALSPRHPRVALHPPSALRRRPAIHLALHLSNPTLHPSSLLHILPSPDLRFAHRLAAYM